MKQRIVAIAILGLSVLCSAKLAHGTTIELGGPGFQCLQQSGCGANNNIWSGEWYQAFTNTGLESVQLITVHLTMDVTLAKGVVELFYMDFNSPNADPNSPGGVYLPGWMVVGAGYTQRIGLEVTYYGGSFGTVMGRGAGTDYSLILAEYPFGTAGNGGVSLITGDNQSYVTLLSTPEPSTGGMMMAAVLVLPLLFVGRACVFEVGTES